jgi:hypothetical protein
MILPETNIHLIQRHIPKELMRLTNEKIKLFKTNNLFNANYSEQIGSLIKYETICTDKNCGGYCSWRQSVIALKQDDDKRWMRKIVFHEVAHALQAESEIFYKHEEILFSNNLVIEWQAETVAYKIYKDIYEPSVAYEEFDSYFREKDVLFLKDWYGDFVQDDFTYSIKEQKKIIGLMF